MRCSGSIPGVLLGALLIFSAFASTATAERSLPTGEGPHLGPITDREPTTPAVGRALRTETWIDLPATVFLPGKADPSEWMATGTWARVTYDGFTYQYGYDPLTQTYDMMVSGYVDPDYGILVQETVGIMAVPAVPTWLAGHVERVEVWFLVASHNLYPFEMVGITAMTDDFTPRSNLNSLSAQLLYEDARGFTGAAYALDHFGSGAHAIDLGPLAVDDLESRLEGDGWFGVGFAADGWDLSGSLGQQVFWRVAGGGGLPEVNRPFFRVVYNAAPWPPQLVSPVGAVKVASDRPQLTWSETTDPNGDSPLTYRVRVGTDPLLSDPVVFDASSSTSARPPLPLGAGTYYWNVEAIDAHGAGARSTVGSFTVDPATDAPSPATTARLGARPNPFNPRTIIEADVPRAGQWRVVVFDTRGRQVRELADGRFDEGRHGWTWDGRDDTGADVGSGVYEVRLRSADGDVAGTRVTLVR